MGFDWFPVRDFPPVDDFTVKVIKKDRSVDLEVAYTKVRDTHQVLNRSAENLPGVSPADNPNRE